MKKVRIAVPNMHLESFKQFCEVHEIKYEVYTTVRSLQGSSYIDIEHIPTEQAFYLGFAVGKNDPV